MRYPEKEKPLVRGQGFSKNQNAHSMNHSKPPAEINAKILPHNGEAEQCLLGSLLSDHRKIDEVVVFLSPSDFYGMGPGKIFARMIDWRAKGKPFNLSLLLASFEDDPDCERFEDYFLDLFPLVITGEAAKHHAKIIRDMADLRRIIKTASDIKRQAYNPGADVGELILKWQVSNDEIRARRALLPVKAGAA